MEASNELNQNLLNLIENSRFKGSKNQPPKRKEPPVKISYEQENSSKNLALKSVTIPSMMKIRQNFETTYGMIQEMRKDKTAPVDTMGSYQNPDPSAPKEIQDYQLLVSLILSVQTKDEPTTTAMNRLIKRGLTIEEIYKTTEDELKELISCVNFKNNKAKYIKKMTDMIVNHFKGKIPDRREDLLKLPGVGKDISIVYLNHVHDKKTGIAVDTHIHRISNRLGWVDTKTAEQTRKELESFVPKEYWYDMNDLLIGFGQMICTSVSPKCEGCLLKTICPTGIKNTSDLVTTIELKRVKKENENDKNEDVIKIDL